MTGPPPDRSHVESSATDTAETASLCERMVKLVPREARSVLVVALDPEPFVTDLLRQGHACVVAASPAEISRTAASSDPFDCVVLHGLGGTEVNIHLRQLHAAMTDNALLVTSAINALHHTNLQLLLRSDLPPDALHGGYATYATTTKCLLDAGFLPHLADTVPDPAPGGLHRAAEPLLTGSRVSLARARRHMNASHHIFAAARVMAVTEQFASTPISFIACVNDELQLGSNLLGSPALGAGTPHEIRLVTGATSVGEAFNEVLETVTHDVVVLVQQDMYLPFGWDTVFVTNFAQARERFSPIGTVGLYGLLYRKQRREAVGTVVDRDRLLQRAPQLPAAVDGLDEILLAMPRDTTLRLDPALGFHLYGTDACLQAALGGLTNVVVYAPAFHNSLFDRPSASFHASLRSLLGKWPAVRPLHSNMGRLDTMAEDVPRPPVDPNVVIRQQKAQVRQLQKELAAAKDEVTRLRQSRLWRLRNWLVSAKHRVL